MEEGLSVDPAEPEAPAGRLFAYDPTSERFARRMARRGTRAPRSPGDTVALEYEFEVVENGERLDFRNLIDEVVGGTERRWFPFDPHARFLPSGAVVTCDETEAELAIAPLARRPGIATVAADELLARRGELAAALNRFNEATERSTELRGYSTHLSAFCPVDRIGELAHRLARTASPAVMLMLDLSTSPGALVRPRGNRLEIAGEYVTGRDDLRAAVVFFLGTLLALAENAALPILGGRILPASGRAGWFVDRSAFGDDLYVDGRMARLALSGGGTILAGTLLGDVWAVARPLIEPMATPEELALVDETVTGERPLPLERDAEAEPELAPLVPIQDFAEILRERHRGGVAVRPVSVSWDVATLEVSTPARSFYANVPREGFGAFVRMLERGGLDRALIRYGRRPFRDRVLELATLQAGLFDAMEVAEAEAPGEAPRITVIAPREATLVQPPQRRRALRRVAVAFATTAMIGAATAVGLMALPASPGRQEPVAVTSRTPEASPTASAKPSTRPAVTRPDPQPHPTVLTIRPPRIPAQQPAQVREPRPAPKPTASAPKPKPKPKPTQTPTTAPTAPSTNRDYSVSITGRTSCSFGTSILDFTVRNADYAPGILDIYVAYNNQKVPPNSAPDYPTHYYSGRASAPVTPAGNNRWVISVRDAAGRVWSTYYIDKC